MILFRRSGVGIESPEPFAKSWCSLAVTRVSRTGPTLEIIRDLGLTFYKALSFRWFSARNWRDFYQVFLIEVHCMLITAFHYSWGLFCRDSFLHLLPPKKETHGFYKKEWQNCRIFCLYIQIYYDFNKKNPSYLEFYLKSVYYNWNTWVSLYFALKARFLHEPFFVRLSTFFTLRVLTLKFYHLSILPHLDPEQFFSKKEKKWRSYVICILNKIKNSPLISFLIFILIPIEPLFSGVLTRDMHLFLLSTKLKKVIFLDIFW